MDLTQVGGGEGDLKVGVCKLEERQKRLHGEHGVSTGECGERQQVLKS